ITNEMGFLRDLCDLRVLRGCCRQYVSVERAHAVATAVRSYRCSLVVVILPPVARVYLLNHAIMYNCVRMKFDGFDPVPWNSSLNWSSAAGTPRIFSAA